MTAIPDLIKAYDHFAKGAGPTKSQWQVLNDLPEDQPITLVNFFRFHARAKYPSSAPKDLRGITGQEAFGHYAAVSVPTLEKVGGRFIFMGTAARAFMGPDEQWDMVVVASYPNAGALSALHSDPAYIEAYSHRVAACEKQRVSIALG